MEGFAPSADFIVVTHSSDTVTTSSGIECKYSYSINGKYEEKETGKIREFTMGLGYENAEDIENMSTYLLYYVNADTDKYINNFSEEDDIFKQIEETINN